VNCLTVGGRKGDGRETCQLFACAWEMGRMELSGVREGEEMKSKDGELQISIY